jgi:hypothetical protein
LCPDFLLPFVHEREDAALRLLVELKPYGRDPQVRGLGRERENQEGEEPGE